MAQHKKKRKRRVQPRFYVIISVFILLVLVLFILIGWTVFSCIKENRMRDQFMIEEERLRSEYADEVNKNPDRYVDVVRPTISYDEFKNGATIPPLPTRLPSRRTRPRICLLPPLSNFSFITNTQED
mgnify:CR=1 FL=1